jgi:hypothetical protein
MRSWIKLHVDDLHDIRFSNLSAEAERTYTRMLRLAGLLDTDGLFMKDGRVMTIEEIAYQIRCDPKKMTHALKELQKSKLIHVNGKGPQIMDWMQRQPNMDEVRKQTRERVTRYRHGVTDGNALHHEVTPPEPEPDSEPDKNQRRPDKKPTTPYPSSTKQSASGRVAGSKNKKSSASSSKNQDAQTALTKKQHQIAEHVGPILQSSGLRNPKLKDTQVSVAIRNFNSKKDAAHYTLAALASAYADTSAENKNSVAAYRIEHNNVPAEFISNTRIWRSLPTQILQAAGYNNLDDYIQSNTIEADPLLRKLRERSQDEE